MDEFLTVAEAVEFIGKSRRTILRLANRLNLAGSDQVYREKTRGKYKWRISKQSLQDAFGLAKSQTVPQITSDPVPTPPVPHDPESTIELARQGYAGIMSMHHEVTQAYEKILEEKDRRIIKLSQELELAQSPKGLWSWIWGN